MFSSFFQMLHQSWYLYTLVGLLSLMIGSLLNVFIHRLPLMMQSAWRTDCRILLDLDEQPEPRINLFFPRSFCPHCKSLVRAQDNIPILSYLWLKGRCAHCHKPISLRYPLVEILTVLLSLAAAVWFGPTVQLIFALLFIWLSIVMIMIDLDHQLLPDSLTLSLLWLGLIANTFGLFTPLTQAVYSAVGGYLSLWLFIGIFYLLTKKVGMGNGDFKLFAAFGAWFGWQALIFILFSASLIGAIVGIIYLKGAQKSRETPLPFGPFLCASGLCMLFFGKPIINYYLSFMV